MCSAQCAADVLREPAIHAPLTRRTNGKEGNWVGIDLLPYKGNTSNYLYKTKRVPWLCPALVTAELLLQGAAGHLQPFGLSGRRACPRQLPAIMQVLDLSISVSWVARSWQAKRVKASTQLPPLGEWAIDRVLPGLQAVTFQTNAKAAESKSESKRNRVAAEMRERGGGEPRRSQVTCLGA
jgi:hypothetical protein